MSIERRTFLSKSTLAGTGILGSHNLPISSNCRTALKPKVIATWENIKAVEATSTVLFESGGALDWVEAGAKLLTERSPPDWEHWTKEKKPFGETNFENHHTDGILAIDAKGNLSGADTKSAKRFKNFLLGYLALSNTGVYVAYGTKKDSIIPCTNRAAISYKM